MSTRMSAPPVRAPRGGLGRLLLSSRTARVAEIVVLLGTPALGLTCVGLLPGDNSGLQQLVTLTSILVMVTLAWLGLWLRGQGWSHFGLRVRGLSMRGIPVMALQVLCAFAGAAALFVFSGMAYARVVGAPTEMEATGLEFLQGNLPALLATLAVVYVTASLSEEIIYRGFLLNRIAELGDCSRSAWMVAVLLSSVAFGFAHFTWGPAGIVQTAFMGLALGSAYLLAGRKLWVAILAHGCMDTILLVQVFLSAPLPAG